jgi:hypothetical protein
MFDGGWLRQARGVVVLVVLSSSAVLVAQAEASRSWASVSVRVRINTMASAGSRRYVLATQTFVVTCDPVGGTFPLAARLCDVIEHHPVAMLDPPVAAETCRGVPSAPNLTVVATESGKTTYFGGSPGCHHPGGMGLELYWLASRGDLAGLTGGARRLQSGAH